MPKNEDGEFELVVGNKQLLSIVFILMVLFGVVFSMGYFLGRPSTGGEPTAAQTPPPTNSQGRPEPVGPESQKSATGSPLQPGEAKVATPDAGTTATSPVTSTPPPAAAAPTPATPATQAAPPPEPPKPAPVPPKQVETPKPAPAASSGPGPGATFLQVAAVKKPQAQMLVEVLKEKGFHATIAPVTVDGQEVFRTLVGPVHGAADLAKTKADLESAGFKPIVKKY